MSRRFTSAGEGVRFSPGTCSQAGAATVGMIARRNVASGFGGIFGSFTSAGAAGYAVEHAASNVSWSPHTGGGVGAAWSSITDWFMILATVTTPTATPQTYARDLTTSATLINTAGIAGTPSSPISFLEAGNWEPATGVGTGGDNFNGWIALTFWFNLVLTSAQVAECYASNQTSDIWNNSAGRPAAIHEWNQAATTTAITDVTGNGANQSNIAGTAVDAATNPTWNFNGLGGPALTGPVATNFRRARMRRGRMSLGAW